MMNEHGKSDIPIVPAKPANKAELSVAESVEGRGIFNTSVFGGAFDEEFKEPTQRFFEQVNSGEFALVTSAIVQDEIVLVQWK